MPGLAALAAFGGVGLFGSGETIPAGGDLKNVGAIVGIRGVEDAAPYDAPPKPQAV